MIDMDLLKHDSVTELLRAFEPEELVFTRSGVFAPKDKPGEDAHWEILGVDRDLDRFQHRGGQALPRKLKVIGHQNARLAYSFMSKTLQAQTYMDIRAAGSADRISSAEADVARETEDMSDVMDRQNEFMMARALQGGFTIKIDDVDVTVSYTIPNSNQFVVGGGGGLQNIPLSWEDPAARIIQDLKNIKLAASQNSGRSLGKAFCSARVAASIIENDNFKTMFGGTNEGTSILRTGFIGRFWGLDWFQADHTYIDSVGAVKQYLDEKKVVFCPSGGGRWAWFQKGSVMAPRDDDSGFDERMGRNGWSEIQRNPPGVTIYGAERRLPVIAIPSAIVIAQVIP